MRERSPVSAWAHTAAAVGVGIGAQALAAPGVRAPDPLALADRVSSLSWIGMFVDWEAPRLPLVDGALVPWLALGALVAALALGSAATERARVQARYALLAGLVVVAVARGWGTFSVWSDLGVGSAYAVLVVYACGAVVLWLLARWIDAYGAAQGAFVLLLAQTVVAGAGELASTRISSEPVGSVIDVVIVGLPSLALCVALALRAPAAWPVRVAGGLELASPLDALGVQVAGFAILSPGVVSVIPGFPDWLCVPLRFAVSAAGFALVWGALRRAPLVRARRLGWFALAAGVLVAEIAWPALAASHLAPATGAAPADRYAVALGSTAVVLAAPNGAAAADAAIVTSRLERLGMHADVVDARDGRIHLTLEYAPDLPALIDIVAARGALSLRVVARDPSLPDPGGAPLLGPGDVLSARSTSSLDAASLVLELTDEGAARVRDLAASGADRRLALLVDDRAVATIPAELAGGTVLRVELGSPRRDPDTVRRAAALAATLSTTPLSTSWTVQSLRRSGATAR